MQYIVLGGPFGAIGFNTLVLYVIVSHIAYWWRQA